MDIIMTTEGMKKEQWDEIQKTLKSPTATTKSREFETIHVDLDDETFIKLALGAHEADMKLNDFMVMVISDFITEEYVPVKVEKAENDGNTNLANG